MYLCCELNPYLLENLLIKYTFEQLDQDGFLYFGLTKNTFLSESERTLTSKEAAQKNFLIVFLEIYVKRYSTVS